MKPFIELPFSVNEVEKEPLAFPVKEEEDL